MGQLHIFKGETSKSLVEIYKEYTGNILDLKCYIVSDKSTSKTKTKLQHINKNKRKTININH